MICDGADFHVSKPVAGAVAGCTAPKPVVGAAISRPPFRIALSLGSNLGDRESFIASMERELRAFLSDVRASGLMETGPVGVDGGQPPYLNKIIAAGYSDTPRRLLEACLAIESSLGRTREKPKAARTADVDILLFGNVIINEEDLIIPHPQLLYRRFCLEGLVMIDPAITIPGAGNGMTAGELHKNMNADVASQNVFWVS